MAQIILDPNNVRDVIDAFLLAVGLGRAKARPEIWPAGHGF